VAARLHAERHDDGRALVLTIDHPKGNVLSLEVMGLIRAALAEVRDEPALRCVFLRGAGGHFSFGASVEEHLPAQAPDMLRGFHAFIRELAGFPVPVVALVEGRCLGGAFEVLLACHFVLAAPGALMGCPEIRLGVLPPVLAALGPLRLGMPLTERLMLTGEPVGPDALDRAGALAGLLPEGAGPEVVEAALAWYRRTLAPLSAFALRQNVRALRAHPAWQAALGAALDAAERQYIAELLPSHDGNEGIAAFLARRSPVWRDA
jgi:cyclohexa-1,5-dienecarbonyl-CoA hydratase